MKPVITASTKLRSVFRATTVTATLTAMALLATLLTVVVLTPYPARAASLGRTVITWNMRGESLAGQPGVKWERARRYMQQAPVLLLQESGSGPPSSMTDPRDPNRRIRSTTHRTVDGDEYENSTWNPNLREGGPYEVYFLQTDTNGGTNTGGRVNIAIMVRGVAEQVRVVSNPVNRGRRALGVRFGRHWYFTFHGLSGGGGDSARMLDAVDDDVEAWGDEDGQEYEWAVGGDFNVRPEVLVERRGFPVAQLYRTGQQTQAGPDGQGDELDYFVANQFLGNSVPRFRLERGGSDHWAVQEGPDQPESEPSLGNLVAGSWNMDGQDDGDGDRESQWRPVIEPRFEEEDMQVLALEEAGNGPPESAQRSARRMPEGVTEFSWDIDAENSRPGVLQIYWVRTGLAFVTREHARDVVQLEVRRRPTDSQAMLGVQIGSAWYFTAHAYSAGNDAEEVIDTARRFMRRYAPNLDWMVLTDFNQGPSQMSPVLQRTMVRADEPTDQGNWAYISNANQNMVNVTLPGGSSGRGLVSYALMGCRPPLGARAVALRASKCDDPIPGHTYRLYSTDEERQGQVIKRLTGSPRLPRLVDTVGDENELVQVLFARRPGTYKLKMGDDCLGRGTNEFGALILFKSCDAEDQSSDWAFSNGKLLSPDANEPLIAGPRDLPEDRFPHLEMRRESYSWRFEDVEEGPGTTDPEVPGMRKRDIRLMPLGDSITHGVESSDDNGFRDELYDRLSRTARNVDFVGSVRAGSMSDPDNEGHPGDRIDEIAVFADCSVERYQPNVITLHAGTNDMNQDYQLPSAPDRLKKLINQVLADSPRATVVAAQLIPTGKAGLQPRIDAYNAALPGVVKDLRGEGKHVVLVDMKRVPVSDGLENDAHPTDAGYAKMADAWYEGLVEAADNGWIKDPLPEKGPGDCDPADSTVGSGETALGVGWRKLGVIAPGMQRPASYDRTEIAEMNGDKRADYVQVRKDGSIRVGINTEDRPGQPTWKNWGGGTGESFPAGSSPQPGASFASSIRFADIDGNGRDDFLVVLGSSDDSTSVDAWLNLSGDEGQPIWNYMARLRIPMKDAKLDHIRFADVNGDGRDDVLRVGDTGEVHAYFNNRTPGSSQPTWTEKLSWAPGVAGATLTHLRFADVDNDNKADYLMVGADGSVHAYLNKGGKDAGGFEGHLNFANASNYPRQYIQFKDISGDGKADYLVVYAEGAVRAWLNRGGNVQPPGGSGGEPGQPPQG